MVDSFSYMKCTEFKISSFIFPTFSPLFFIFAVEAYFSQIKITNINCATQCHFINKNTLIISTQLKTQNTFPSIEKSLLPFLFFPKL